MQSPHPAAMTFTTEFYCIPSSFSKLNPHVVRLAKSNAKVCIENGTHACLMWGIQV